MKKLLISVLVLALGVFCLPLLSSSGDLGVKFKAASVSNDNNNFFVTVGSGNTQFAQRVNGVVNITKGVAASTFTVRGSGATGTLVWELRRPGASSAARRQDSTSTTFSLGWGSNDLEEELGLGILVLSVRNAADTYRASIEVRIRYEFPPSNFWSFAVTNQGGIVTPTINANGVYEILFNTETTYDVLLDWENLVENTENINPDPKYVWEVDGVAVENTSPQAPYNFKYTKVDQGTFTVVFKMDDEVIHYFNMISRFDKYNLVIMKDSVGGENKNVSNYVETKITLMAVQANPNANPDTTIESFDIVKRHNQSVVVEGITLVLNAEGNLEVTIPKNFAAGEYMVRMISSIEGVNQDAANYLITVVDMKGPENTWIQVLILGGIAAVLGGSYMGLNYILKIYNEKRALKQQMALELEEQE